MGWYYNKHESVQERKNMLKGFLTLLLISLIILAIVALLVFFVAIYRTHPEYFEPQEVLLDTFKNSTPTDLI